MWSPILEQNKKLQLFENIWKIFTSMTDYVGKLGCDIMTNSVDLKVSYHQYDVKSKRLTIGWECGKDMEHEKLTKNFGGKTSLKQLLGKPIG
jgi:coenzyme F420-reducing hydrogenase beta subunit